MLEYLFAMLDLKVGLLFGAVFCVVKSYLNSYPPKGLPPGPPVVPFIGNMNLTLGNDRVFDMIHQLGKKYGPVFTLQMGWYPFIVINDFNLMKEAFIKAADQCSNRFDYLPLLKIIGAKDVGVLNSSGDHWKASRRFCISSLRDFGMGKATIEGKILEEADNIIFEIGKQRGEPFKFELLFNKASSNIISSMLFGKRYDYKDPVLIQLLESLKIFMENSNLFRSPTVMIPCLMPLIIFSRRTFGALKMYASMAKHLKKEVKEHRQRFDPDNIQDFIDAFLERESQNINSSVYSEKNLIELSFDLFLAGTDTSSTTLNWAMYFMLKYPQVQEKCREEIIQVIGNDRKPSLKDRDNMPYVDATLCEVLRLGNIAPLAVPHSTFGSVELNGYTIPHHTGIIPDIYSVHMNPDLWEEPKIFKPERFLNAQGKVERPPHFIPFSLGRRACLGENLAKSEIFLFFVSMLQNFVYTCEDVSKLPTLDDAQFGITLQPGPYHIMADPV